MQIVFIRWISIILTRIKINFKYFYQYIYKLNILSAETILIVLLKRDESMTNHHYFLNKKLVLLIILTQAIMSIYLPAFQLIPKILKSNN